MDSDEFDSKWPKMARLLTLVTNSIKSYVDDTDTNDIMTHEELLIAIQTFVFICSGKWGISQDDVESLISDSKAMYRYVKMNADSSAKGDVQQYAYTVNKKVVN